MKNKHKKRQLILSMSKAKGDFKVETFKSGGKGGQHQNKTDSGARVIHVASGIWAESRSDRSQHRNIRLAFKRLTSKKEFKSWMRLEIARRTHEIPNIPEVADITIREEDLKIETKVNGKWVVTKD